MTSKVIGTGSYVPERVVTNEDLAKVVDTNDEWIVTRTGIHERRIAMDEGTSFMAAEASRRALADPDLNLHLARLMHFLLPELTGQH